MRDSCGRHPARLAAWGLLALAGSPALADSPAAPDFLLERQPRTRLLLLGTFHFADAGLDAHKPTHAFDALSEKRQTEIAEVLDRLARFRPTRIALEVPRDRQERLDQDYARFLAGESEVRANETYQIGFRLGQRLGVERLYAVDAPGRSYDPDMTREQFDARVASLLDGVDPARVAAEAAWDERFERMYAWEDALVDRQTLAQHLIFANDEETLRRHHGHYLVGEFKLGRDGDYLGADLKTRWYNRNLRIFQNLLRIPAGPSDRILLLIGAGHVPILRQAALSSPDFHLVEVREVLGEGTGGTE
jgi:hypothetical protein